MPRAQGGIGRQGKKHKRAATHDLQRQLKVQGTSAAPPATAKPVLESTAIEEEADPAQASGDPPPPPAVAAADTSAAAYVPQPHPNYDRDEPFLPGYRGAGGGYGDEKWDPDEPPCVPSDERPDAVFGSILAAKAVAAADILEASLPQGDPDASDYEEGEEREECEEVARVKYVHALSRLAKAFPELKIPAGLHAGVEASAQETRPCPCGVGLLPRWPWVLQTASLGFCPSNELDWIRKSTDEKAAHDRSGRHVWEMTSWRSEWIGAAPGGDRIAW